MNLMRGSGFGSRISLGSNHDNENDDDNFDDTISILLGQTPTSKKDKLFGEISHTEFHYFWQINVVDELQAFQTSKIAVCPICC